MELFRGYGYAPNTKGSLAKFLSEYFLHNDIVLLCLGTDKLVGDCLAPLVAEKLRQNEFPFYIYGGLNAPITAQNAQFAYDFIRTIHPTSKIILVDSMATTKQANLGDLVVTKEYLGAFRNLEIYPDLCIYGVTSLLHNNLLNCARLRNVEFLANLICNSILYAYEMKKSILQDKKSNFSTFSH